MASSRPVHRRWTEADPSAVPIVSVTLGDGRVPERTRADPPLGAAAAAFATINFLRQNGLICAAVATDRTPETPSSAE